MSIGWRDVEPLLISELPEFSETVRQHRKDWPDLPMEYLLIGQLYSFVVNALNNEPNEVGREIARRVYALVELALREGDEAIQNCVSIEMIEPFMSSHNPQIESIMGPIALQDLGVKREWSRRYRAMSSAIIAANVELGGNVFLGVGVGTETARITADRLLWTKLPPDKCRAAFRSLRKHWTDLRGLLDSMPESGLEITGTREELFVILAADNSPD